MQVKIPMDYIQHKLIKAGFECYIVGGAVRDMLLGLKPNDIDYVTNATPDQIIEVFKGHKVNLVGKSFGVVLVDDTEVATYRKDTYPNGTGAKNCVVEYADTIEEDLSRRDLTINAMAVSPEGELVDPFGGFQDLVDGVIRFVGNPVERIKEDPCRILRACRFSALFGVIDLNSLEAMRDEVDLLKSVAPERVRLEMLKAMKLPKPSLFFLSMFQTGALELLLPELHDCFMFPTHGQHHKESLQTHLLLAGNYISPKFPILRLAAFLHDIGKPEAYRKNNDGSFSGHEVIGEAIAKKMLKRLKFTNDEISQICNVVRLHMRPIRGLSPKAARRLRKVILERKAGPRDLIRMKMADYKANIKHKDPLKLSYIKEMLINVGLYSVEEEAPLRVTDLALSGGEIIKLFGLKPGPKIGKIQRYLLEKVLDDPKLNSKEALIEEVKAWLDLSGLP